MQVQDDVWVTVRYRLYDAQGDAIEPGVRELRYMQGGYGAVFEDIEQALAGHEAGFTTSVFLEPEDSFGEYDAQLVRLVPRAQLPDELEVGMTFEGIPGDDDDDDTLYIVTDFTAEAVVLDGNHPLAGMALRFDLELVDVSDATEEEIAAERASAEMREDDDFDDDEDDDTDEDDDSDDRDQGDDEGDDKLRRARDPRHLH